MPAAATWNIALAVIRHADRFLVVNEKKDRGWYLPAGRVDPHETLVQGAAREVLEETGIIVAFDGILRVEHTPSTFGRDARLRAVFIGHPTGGTLKTEPDDESLGAAWVTLEECARLRLRSDEVLKHFHYVESGGAWAPLDLLTFEGAPYPTGT